MADVIGSWTFLHPGTKQPPANSKLKVQILETLLTNALTIMRTMWFWPQAAAITALTWHEHRTLYLLGRVQGRMKNEVLSRTRWFLNRRFLLKYYKPEFVGAPLPRRAKTLDQMIMSAEYGSPAYNELVARWRAERDLERAKKAAAGPDVVPRPLARKVSLT